MFVRVSTLMLGLVVMPVEFVRGQSADSGNPFLPAGQPATGRESGWPSVRGPDFDGHSAETHIADSWPEAGPPVLWTRELGQGYSAFVAQGRRVYTQAQTLGGQYVICLDADTGDTVWEYRYGWPYESVGVYPGPRATPTINDGRVYFAAPDGLLGCLTADGGELVWSRKLIEDYKGRGGAGFGYSCTPTVIDGLVIMPVGGQSASMVALDAKTGREVWSEGDEPSSYCPAFPIEHRGRKLVVGYLQNSLVIHDRLTGELLHQMDLSHGYDEHSCWPIWHEPYLWLAAPFQAGSQLLELPKEFNDETKLDTVWRDRIMSNDIVSSVLVGGRVYGFDIFDVQSKTQRPSRGKFRCIDLMQGDGLWSQGTGRPRRGGPQDDPNEIGQCGIVVADGKLIILNERGELILLRVNPDELEELARTSVLGGELTWTPPILHRGRVYVRNQSRAVCLYVGEPDLLDTSQPTLTVDDVPQTEYRDWAATILRVEPEYAFDIPSRAWLTNWYFACLAMLTAAGLLGLGVSRAVPKEHRPAVMRGMYRTSAFVGGAVGTTALSQAFGDFVFTWPLCLFVAFEPVPALIRRRRGVETPPPRQRWIERGTFAVFLVVCLVYFLICRRLSLVFEWAFLIGFLGAVPFLWVRRFVTGPGTFRRLSFLLLTGLAFSGFYACGLIPLVMKY